jgi:NADH dehydrogenase (ubiquinone) Fe-S protein 3
MNPLSIKNLKNLIPIYQILHHNNDEISIVVLSKDLISVLKILKLHINYQYNLLSCISGIDLLGFKYRFCIVYELLSITNNSRIRVKVYINEVSLLKSSVSIYNNANWWEREVWDMYGLYFQDHPDLRRILTDYGFEGYPLRKDFPLTGYLEVRYDFIKKMIVHDFIYIAQEFRSFAHENQW